MPRQSRLAETTRCPACGGGRLKSFGTPRVIDTVIVRSHPAAVCRCLDCDLLFFVPVQPMDVLLNQYSVLAQELWNGESRPDWTLARQAVLQRMAFGRVLDVGCWTGSFLASLPPQYGRWGVEPSLWARNQAASKGVKLVGDSLTRLMPTPATYDAITMIDVIEHTTTPLEALVIAASRLRDNGILVVATGNSRALAWRMMPRDYWYYFAEHVCFFSEPWFRWAAARSDLGVEEVTRFSRFPADDTWTPYAELASACAFRLLGGQRSIPVRIARRAHMLRRSVETHRWRDHILVVLRKWPGYGLPGGG